VAGVASIMDIRSGEAGSRAGRGSPAAEGEGYEGLGSKYEVGSDKALRRIFVVYLDLK
jgi:hypothetical protein